MALTPGSNLLRRASRLIKNQTCQYYAATGRTQNASRQWVPTFAAATPVAGSIQAVNRSSYKAMGLQFNAYYVQIWTQSNMVDLDRDTSGDRFIFNGDLYTLKDAVDWFTQDGWSQCIAMRIKRGATGPD